MNAIVVSKLTSFLPSRNIKNACIPQFKELQLADPEFYKPAPIDIIIGSDILPYINLNAVRFIMEHGLEARESQLGWSTFKYSNFCIYHMCGRFSRCSTT